MNELKLVNKDGVWYANSREVAVMIEKRHTDLLRDIGRYSNILTDAKLRSLNFFVESSYVDAKGETRPCYLLTKKGCDMVANKLTGEKGVIFTAKYVTKFEEMEKQLQNSFDNQIPKDLPSALIAYANTLIEKQKLQKQLEEAKPKLTYYESILNSDGTMNSTQVAADYGMSARKLNKILHEAHLIYKSGGQWVLYEEHKGKGYTESRTFDFQKTDGSTGSTVHTYWTQKGRLKIHEILTELGYVANFDKTESMAG